MFRGIATPVMTAIDPEQGIDYAAMEKIIEFLLAAPVDGLLFLGSSGEFFAFSRAEKRQLIQFACNKVAGRCKVLIGTGGTDMRDVLTLTDYAAQCGADAAAIISPYYFSFDENTVSHFYQLILQHSPLPIIAYNFPERTGYNLTARQLKQLALDYPHFIGVKDTVDNISHTREIIQTIKSVRADFCVWSGYDEYYLPNLIAGGDGCIAAMSNFIPQLYRQLFDDFNIGNFTGACQQAALISEAMPIYRMSTPFIPAIKAAMQAIGLPITPDTRSPVMMISKHDTEAIKTFIHSISAKLFRLQEDRERQNISQ